jgi:acyl-CoA thioester hydrolase
MRVVPSASDIDALNHVNNSVYLRWVEEVVVRHWRSAATPVEMARFHWVALRHEIDYRSPAFEGEELIVLTRLEEVRRARAWYRTSVDRGEVRLVEARSCWGCIDATTGRLTVIPPNTASRILANQAQP